MKDLKAKNEKELRKILADKREALRAFRYSVAGGRTRNTKEGEKIKKEIARILTLINSKAILSK